MLIALKIIRTKKIIVLQNNMDTFFVEKKVHGRLRKYFETCSDKTIPLEKIRG